MENEEPKPVYKNNPLITVKAVSERYVSYVYYQAEELSKRRSAEKRQNSFSFLHQVLIENAGDDDLLDYELFFSFSPAVVTIAPVKLSCLEAHKTTEVDSFSATMDVERLYSLSEALPMSLRISLKDKDGAEVSSGSASFELLPIGESASDKRIDEILASFVTPNDDLVKDVVGKAARILEKDTGESAFTGYQTHDPNVAYSEMAALFKAMHEEGIRYSNPPASFEKIFQRVRLPYEVLKERVGTCLDFALLYCSLAESVGLKPILIVISGHALAGVYLKDENLMPSKEENGSNLLKHASKGFENIAIIDVTEASADSEATFKAAVDNGYSQVRDNAFEYALDIAACRKERLLPIPTPHEVGGGKKEIPFPFKAVNEDATPTYDEGARRYLDPNGKGDKDRFDYWEDKLLDLSLKNRLISLRFGPRSMQLILSGAENAVSYLGKNEKLTLIPYDLKDDALKASKDPVIDFSSLAPYKDIEEEAEGRKSLLAASRLGDVGSILKGLARRSNMMEGESGCNPLFLTLGLIRWYDNEKAAVHGTGAMYAPLFLLPVKMPRRKTGPGYSIEYSFDDFSLNTTILEYFRQTFHFDFSPIMGTIRKNKDGLPDVRPIINFVRERISSYKGWALYEDVSTLALFSFARFVMWTDLKRNRGAMMSNPLIYSLVKGERRWQSASGVVPKEKLDDSLSPASLAIPLPADSSQIHAVQAADAGASFILDGPPGTGKSQTIANMITNALFHDKSVLFVAEKGVALEVVKKRLDDIGLGRFCLMVPSVTAAKRDILKGLGDLLEFGSAKSPDGYGVKSGELKAKRDELNLTLKKLHEKGKYFISTYDAIIGYLERKRFADRYATDEKYAKALTEKKYDAAISSLRTLKNELDVNGSYYENAFLPFYLTEYSLEERDRAFKDIAPLEGMLVDASKKFEKARKPYPNLGSRLKDAKAFAAIRDYFEEDPNVFPNLVDKKAFSLNEANERGYLKLILKERQCEERIKPYFNDGCLTLDGASLSKTLDEAKNLSFFKRRKALKPVKKALKPYAIDKKSLKLASLEEAVPALKDLQAAKAKEGSFGPYPAIAFKDVNLKTSEDVKKALATFERSISLYRLAESLSEHSEDALNSYLGLIGSFAHSLDLIYEGDVTDLIAAYKGILALNEDLKKNHRFDIFRYDDCDDYFLVASKRLHECLSAPGRLSSWVNLENAMRVAKENVPEGFFIALKAKKIPTGEIEDTYIASTYFRILSFKLSNDGLSTLSAAETEKKADEYRNLLSEFAVLSIKETASRITEGYPSNAVAYASSSSVYQLRKLAHNGGKGTTLRQIFAEYGDLIKTLCPCFLMSPLAVSQYLSIDSYKFDLVIFDEASQIPTSEAVGAIARGKAVVIAGDQEQMPPSDFFSASYSLEPSDEDEIASLDEDLESLLDDAIVLGLPRIRLNWHYRSKHESLIAYSNSKFYENSLLTFPSPTDERGSVKFVKVNGRFEHRRGVNREEAKAVVNEVLRRLRDKELVKHSIGIVTFNEAQENLIDDMLDAMLDQNPGLEQNPGGESIFVKNLENVQGDERDVILFSIAYARDKDDKEVSLNFGPLSRERGERRLNVAVSRAREAMIVFSSVEPEDIHYERAKNKGARYLHDFLLFAKGGAGTLMNNASNSISHSGVSVANFLAKDLEKRGYKTKLNLGSSSFKIDLAVMDKENPDKCVLGIITDGDSYCAPITCRDRNAVQPMVLNGLKWRIFRLWSVEYLDHPEEVVNAIEKAINEPEPEAPKQPKQVRVEIEFEKKGEGPVYPHAAPFTHNSGMKLDIQNDFYHDLEEIRRFLDALLASEAPFSRATLEKYFREASGISRVTNNQREKIDAAIEQSGAYVVSCDEIEFIFASKEQSETYSRFRVSPKKAKDRRDILDISFIELGNAMADLLSVNGKISAEDLITLLRDLFGYSALKDRTRNYLYDALKWNDEKRKILKVDDEYNVTLREGALKKIG
jgi:hypothetical protein